MFGLIIRNTETGERTHVEVPYEFEVGETLYRAEIVNGHEMIKEYEVEEVFEILLDVN